ncbi:VWA domain-containing protein [Corynebacterium sp. MSK008]|uniref:VWA domain-containing protein n=1 Tax=Corynebacterium sp. MSK008 TaxID=3050188 RepID=UPI00254D227F|nr:VWA domain-containing protein [Corynebacterium sp. MSK008]MDK8879126.1 VWA domain-containing protein [Corynebacterium sp. MSK008]
MRNILKPAARTASSRARRSVRGVAAVVASVALAAGMGSYPVDAQETSTETTTSAVETTASTTAAETPSSSQTASEAPKPVVAEPNSVTVERDGDVDHITIRDTDDNPWDSGRKASDEYIWGVKRIGDGDITRIVKVVADGEELDPQYFGYVNGEDFDVIGIDEDAFWTIPPMKLEIEVETTEVGDYAIAEPDEVPTARELSETGYGRTDQAAATVNPEGVGMARAATQGNSRINLPLKSKTYSNISEPSGDSAPRGTLKTSIMGQYSAKDVYLTELVLTHNNASARYSLSGPITIRKNGGSESCTVQPHQITELSRRSASNGGSVNAISVDLSSCDPQIVVWQGSGDLIEIDFNGPKTGNAQLDYTMELYGSYESGGGKRFSVVADPDGSVKLSPARTEGDDPYYTTSSFEDRTNFERAIVEVSAPNSFIAVENYGVTIDLIESGVTLERRVVSASSNSVTFEVYPVKNGKRVESALVEKGANLKLVTKFSDEPSEIDAKVTVYGTSVQRPPAATEPVSEPDRSTFLPGRVPNPALPEKCGLKIAIVADVSTSLQYADGVDAFEKTRTSAKSLVDKLAGTTTKVGIYSFARTAQTQTPTGAVSIQTQQGVDQVKNAINSWREQNGGATNWEAALSLVGGKGYDAVYFITDGMPTWDDGGWQPLLSASPGQMNSGAFVQATSLKNAVQAANALKADGTRVVPLLVDLKLRAGNTVEGDYVLKDVIPNWAAPNGALGMSATRTLKYPADDRMVYAGNGLDTVVNVKEAVDRKYLKFYIKGDREITSNQNLWTYGFRSVVTMGEDISGDGDAIRVAGGYAQLGNELDTIASKLKENCESSFTVKKNIVDQHGNLLKEGASDWDFDALSNSGPILDPGDGTLTGTSSKTTNQDGLASWRLESKEVTDLRVSEKLKDGYKLFQVDGANAKCTQSVGDFVADVPMVNDGDAAFKIEVPAFSHVTCVVSNYEPKDEFVKLELEKLDATDKFTLSNAKFEVRSEREGEGPFAVNWDEGSQTYKTEAKLSSSKTYYLVETQAPTKEGQQYSLLVAPVEFQIVSGENGYVVQIRDGEAWASELVGAGLWTDRPQEFDAATGYLQVANVRQGNMPKTGGVGVQLPILLGGALIAAGALMGRRKVAA